MGHLWSTALQRADLLAELSAKQKVTTFAVQDSFMDSSNLPSSTVLNRLVHDALLYTPDMSDGMCLKTRGGGTMQISLQGSNILVNDARLVKSNVITKNGVIHYLDKVRPNFLTFSVILLNGRIGSAFRGMYPCWLIRSCCRINCKYCRLNRNCGRLHGGRF